MEVLLKVCVMAGVGVLAVSLLRKNSAELSYAATLATIVVLGIVASGVLNYTVEFVYELVSFAGIDEQLIKPMIKCVGISAVTKLACDICRDSGVNAAASYIELVGGCAAIMTVAPLMMTVLKSISG